MRKALEHGILGHSDGRHMFFPKVVQALLGKRVVGVSAGSIHTAAWTEAGELFSWGVSDDGQLGHGDNDYKQFPTLVEALRGQRVVAASAGDGHTVAVTDAGVMYSWGGGRVCPLVAPAIIPSSLECAPSCASTGPRGHAREEDAASVYGIRVHRYLKSEQ